jgi:hypothetical protein
MKIRIINPNFHDFYIRKSSSPKIHRDHPVTGDKSRSETIPGPAVGGYTMNTEDLLSLSFPNGQLDFHTFPIDLHHDWFLQYSLFEG